MSCSTKQRINKETKTFNDAIGQFYLSDIYRTFSPQNNEFHLFSQAHTEPSPRWITSWAINLALVNSEKLKSFQASFHVFVSHPCVFVGEMPIIESISPKVRNKTRVSTFTATIQHSSGSFGHSNQSRKRNKRNPNWKRRSKTLTVCR